jgi:hypothetical protein
MKRNPPIVPLACLACSLALAACGGASAAHTAVLDSDAAASAGNPVAVSPMPGTPDASPDTQISFLGGSGTKVLAVRAVGSRSGVHAGVVRAYSTGTGESFLPAHPFVPGERVTVTAQVSVGGATREAKTGFEIAHQVAVSQTEFPINPGDAHDVQRCRPSQSPRPPSRAPRRGTSSWPPTRPTALPAR